jgi:hypothetical protein
MLARDLIFNVGHGNVFCCKTFTSTIHPKAKDPAPAPSARMLSYLDRLVTCANTDDLSGPPRRDHEKDFATLNSAKFLVKMFTIDDHPGVLVVYMAPSDLKKEWGSMIEISRGNFNFGEHFSECVPMFEGTETLDAKLRCEEHDARWYVEIYMRKEVA